MPTEQDILAGMLRESDLRVSAAESILVDARADLEFEKAFRERIREKLAAAAESETPHTDQLRRSFDVSQESIPTLIVRVLSDERVPMRARDIAAVLEDMGVQTSSDRGLLPQVLSALSRKTDTFRRVAHGTYGLIEWENGTGEMAERTEAPQAGQPSSVVDEF